MNATLTLVLGLSLASCAVTPAPPGQDGAQRGEIARATALLGPEWPASSAVIATTDGEIYLGNLDAQLETIETTPGLRARAEHQVLLASLYYQRFQIEGRLADAERARDILDAARSAPGFGAQHRLVHAQVLLGFHDFEAAREQISAAAEAGAGVATEALRASLERSLSLPAMPPVDRAASPSNYHDAVRAAAALVDRGELHSASRQLRLAQDLYPDSSPFPLAWIHLQQGIAFLRHGALDQAREFFAAAHARFPQYFLATEHLAETESLLGNHARAAELYRQVTAQNDQPAFWHGLAQAEAALGNAEAARQAAERARSGYAALLARYPLMYADHAVGYYLDTGEVAEALRLARLNFEHRQDLSAHLALAEALWADGQRAAACALAGAVGEAGLAPPELTLPTETLNGCSLPIQSPQQGITQMVEGTG